MNKVEEIYKKCLTQLDSKDVDVINYVKDFYAPFTADQISKKISELLTSEEINAEVEIVFQSIENLHKACPEHLGDWYFTGDYPTPGGYRVAHKAFLNFYENKDGRSY